jgi:hypothetical protein
MSKPRVLVCVLTGNERTNWICTDLSAAIFRMSKDPRFDISYYPVRDMRPFELARNQTIRVARDEVKADWLISFDNDNFPYGNPLDIIATAKDKHVIGLPSACLHEGRLETIPRAVSLGPTDGDFQKASCVGGGCLMIHKTVWQRIPRGPYFRWISSEKDEGFSPEGVEGEDLYFCKLVRRHGIEVWTHTKSVIGHYRTVDLSALRWPGRR